MTREPEGSLGEELARARARIDVLAELAEALAAARTIADVGRAVIERGMKLAQADTCTLYLLDEATKVLELVAERGVDPAVVEKIRRIPPDADNPVYAVGIGKKAAMWVETEKDYDALLPKIARVTREGPRARAFWSVPLEAEGETIGLLGVGFYEERTFDAEERRFVGTLARQAAQALARGRRLVLAERLRASLATTLRSIGDAVIATDARGHVTLMNGVAESLTGYPEAEARGRPLADVFRIVNEHTRAPVESPVDRVLAIGGVVGLANHTVLLARDGREIPIDDSGAPIRAEGSSTIEGVVLVFRDVIERKREEQRRTFLADATAALAESLDYELTVGKVARLVVPQLADWCSVDLVTEDGERNVERLAVAHVDPKKIQLAHELDRKYPPPADAPRGSPNVLRTGKAELYAEVSPDLLAQSATNEEHLAILRELQLRSAMIVPLAVRGRVLGTMTFVFAESGRRYDATDLAFAEDVARRCAIAIENARIYASEQRARRAAAIASRAKDEFLAVVSHELRTPLNAIMGWSKMLAVREFDESRRQAAVETIERNSVAMAQLIEDLLDMSRVISGKMRLELHQVEIGRVVEAAIESAQPAANARSIAILSSIEPDVPHVMGDPTRLQQVVWNLLSNAVKFTPIGKRIDVRVWTGEGVVHVSVVDTGQGIAPAFLPNVFEAFRQEDPSPSRARGGLGLGLAISRQLVELHGGHIEARSDGEGHGATFEVTLPIPEATAKTSTRATTSVRREAFERPVSLRGLKVLVVDDDDDARNLVAAILDDCGCVVTTAESAGTAMLQFQASPPDVLLSDIAMPGEDGYDLIAKIRALPRGRGGEVPAAALTSYARPEERRRMLNAGYSIHLPKPIEPAELVAVVTTLSRFRAPSSS